VRLLRLLFRLVLVAVLLAPFAVAGAVYLALDRRPTVVRATEIAPEHVERAKKILDTNDPRRLRTGTVRTVAVTAGDADLALNYLAQRYGDGGAEAQFEAGRLRIRASLRAAVLPMSPYVNVDLLLAEGSPHPSIERFRVGQLPLPAWVARAAFNRLVATVWSADDLATLRGAIKQVRFANTGARLTYEWHGMVLDAVRAGLIYPAGRERLRVYQQALADATRQLPPGAVSLVDLVTPLFAEAARRSATSDAVMENRAAIVVLTFYVDGRSLDEVVPEARSWPRAPSHSVTLNGRDDFPKHFMISAALSANTGGPFADAVGIYKEVADSRGGSGFSFNDIAADRAGSRLGTLAEGRESARPLQVRLGVPLTERVVMPETRDLPEFMPEPEFNRRFGGIGAPAYNRMMADIDRRVAALPLHQ
jgi:hypothetical protein